MTSFTLWRLLAILILMTVAGSSLPPTDRQISPDHTISDSSIEGFTNRYVAVIDAGSTGSRLYLHRCSFRLNPYAPKGNKVDMRLHIPAIVSKRVSPGIAVFALNVPNNDEDFVNDSQSNKAAGDVVDSLQQQLPHQRQASASSAEKWHSDAAPTDNLQSYLSSLYSVVLEALPEDFDRRHIFLFLRCTAGVRALPKPAQQALVRRIERHLKSWGLLMHESSVGVLPGTEEGALGWLVLNQLLGRLKLDHVDLIGNGIGSDPYFGKNPEASEQYSGDNWAGGDAITAAFIEMGGASVQVSFEIPELSKIFTQERDVEKLMLPSALYSIPGKEDLFTLQIRNKKYVLLNRSYHGIGRQLGLFQHSRRTIIERLEESFGSTGSTVGELDYSKIVDAYDGYRLLGCLPRDVALLVDLEENGATEVEQLTQKISTGLDRKPPQATSSSGVDARVSPRATTARVNALGSSDYLSCLKSIHLTWRGLACPSMEIPPNMTTYATENYFHFNEYVVQGPNRPFFTPLTFLDKASKLCNLTSKDEVKKYLHPNAADEKAKTACFGLVLMSRFLSEMLKVKDEQQFTAIHDVQGNEISWTVGLLTLYLPEVAEKYLGESTVTGYSEDTSSRAFLK